MFCILLYERAFSFHSLKCNFLQFYVCAVSHVILCLDFLFFFGHFLFDCVCGLFWLGIFSIFRWGLGTRSVLFIVSRLASSSSSPTDFNAIFVPELLL